MDYECLKVSLILRYDFTERRYREKFREPRPEGHESPSQFIFRLKKLFHLMDRVGRSGANFHGRR